MTEIKDFYDDDAEEYGEKRFTENDWQKGVHQKLLNDFLNDLPANSRILEVGCGTGRFTKTIVDRGFDTTAVDISCAMLRKTRRRCEGTKTQAQPKLLNADVNKLPFGDNYFDACVMVNVVSHLPNPKKGFSEISRVVRKDGSVFSNFTNLLSFYFPVGILVNTRGRSVQEDVYSRWYSWSEIDEIFANAGLEVMQIRGHMIPPRKKYPVIDNLIKVVDSLSRDSLLRFFAGNRFYHLRVNHVYN